jgi:hypothetical protein
MTSALSIDLRGVPVSAAAGPAPEGDVACGDPDGSGVALAA